MTEYKNTCIKITTALSALLFVLNICSAQLGDNNMYLLANLNEHRIPPIYNAPWHYAGVWGYAAPNGREYAILGAALGTAFIDITDSANIHEVYFRPALINFLDPDPGNLWKELKVYSHYAYVVSEADTSGVEIFDLQYLPDSVRYVGKYFVQGHSSTHTISQSGPYLYLNGANASFGQGVTVLDLTADPEQPVRRGSWNTEYVHDCRVINDTIWAANIYSGKLSVIDARNKDSLIFITSWQTLPNAFTHNCALTTDRKYIYTTDETENPPGKLKVWDIQNLLNVILDTIWQPANITTAIVHNVEIFGDTAVIAHYTAGVRVLDVSNPVSPVEIAWYDTYPQSNTNQFDGCWAVYRLSSGKIIASDMQTGLHVLKVGNPIGVQNNQNVINGFSLGQNFPNPFNPATTIKFNIPAVGERRTFSLRLAVYDVRGREVQLLIQQPLEAGEYHIQWDGSRFSSGIYIYRLEVSEPGSGSILYTQSRKMILIK